MTPPSAQAPSIVVEKHAVFEAAPPLIPHWPSPQQEQDGPEPMDWEPLAPSPSAVLESPTLNRTMWIDRLRMFAAIDSRMSLFIQTGYMTAGLARALIIVAALAIPVQEPMLTEPTSDSGSTSSSKSLVVATIVLEAILASGLLAKAFTRTKPRVSSIVGVYIYERCLIHLSHPHRRRLSVT